MRESNFARHVPAPVQFSRLENANQSDIAKSFPF